MKYFIHIAFDGSKYRGWQRQANVKTVQETIELHLERIFKKPITVYGCGRTDAGVHASQFFLHIKPERAIDFDLVFILNKNLPSDIRVYDVIAVEPKANARFSAVTRTYDYYLHQNEDPILSDYSTHYELSSLDLEQMQEAVYMLKNLSDFQYLCKQPHLQEHTRCIISDVQLIPAKNNDRLRFSITSNRFLKGMIRICMRYLLMVGNGELSVKEFEEIATGKKVIEVKHLAPANGLYLSKLNYPFLNLPVKSSISNLLKLGLEG